MEESLHHTPHSWPHKQLLYSMNGKRYILMLKEYKPNELYRGNEVKSSCECIIEVKLPTERYTVE